MKAIWIWFITDNDDILVETGNSHKMKFRSNQDGFRKYSHLQGHPTRSFKVHLIDILSGRNTNVPLEFALSKTTTELTSIMKEDIDKKGSPFGNLQLLPPSPLSTSEIRDIMIKDHSVAMLPLIDNEPLKSPNPTLFADLWRDAIPKLNPTTIEL